MGAIERLHDFSCILSCTRSLDLLKPYHSLDNKQCALHHNRLPWMVQVEEGYQMRYEILGFWWWNLHLGFMYLLAATAVLPYTCR